MNLEHKFTALQLSIINEQASLYDCACPLQVSMQITSLRKLFDYQNQCANSSAGNDLQFQVHQRIAEATVKAHLIMEQCLDEILDLEGWDRDKLQMPEGMRRKIN